VVAKDKLSIAFVLTIISFVASCGNKTARSTDTDSVASAENIEDVIRRRIDIIYKDVGKSTTDAEGNLVDYIHSSFNRDSAYCSQRYYALMQEASEVCDMTGDILYDYDHWICGQDFSDDWSCSVSKVYDVTDSSALVDLVIHNFGDRETTIALRYERGDWYVDDFSPSAFCDDDKAYLRSVIQQGKQALRDHSDRQ